MLALLWMTRATNGNVPGWGDYFHGYADDGTVSVSSHEITHPKIPLQLQIHISIYPMLNRFLPRGYACNPIAQHKIWHVIVLSSLPWEEFLQDWI